MLNFDIKSDIFLPTILKFELKTSKRSDDTPSFLECHVLFEMPLKPFDDGYDRSRLSQRVYLQRNSSISNLLFFEVLFSQGTLNSGSVG